MSSDAYFFHQSAEELAQELLRRQKKTVTTYMHSGVLNRARRMYNAYYGRYFRGTDGSMLGKAGEQSELVTLSANHLRNIILHTMALLTTNKLSFDCQSEATDVDARNACLLGNSLVDQLFYDDRIEEQVLRTVELGLIMGTAFLSVMWDPTVKLIGKDEQGNPVYSGKPRVRSHSIFDVLQEPFIDNEKDHNWRCLREMVSRWELIAMFPDKEQEIKDLPRITDIQWYDPTYTQDDDHVFLYRAFHRETPALPGGRMTWFCENDVILLDNNSPYVHPTSQSPNGGMPIFSFRPATHYGTAYGHSIIMDMAPLQEALNILDSSILTNQDNFAVQNIIVCKESNISSTDLSGGNKLIEYNVVSDAPNAGKPEVLQLCATPAEVFNYRKELIQNLEILSGINAVLRGQPQASLISGTALALVATQANSFNSVLEANYTRFAEDVAHFLLFIISRFQTTEELVALVGKGKSNEIRRFKGEQLNPIRKVKVILGNPLARTTAGKVEIAEMLTKNQIIKTPAAVLEAIQTGNITQELDNTTAEISYIKFENEALLRGENPPVIGSDTHPQHILEHRTLTFNPDVRADANLIGTVLKHIQDHIDQQETMAIGNPMLLNLVMGAPMPLPTPAPDTRIGPAQAPVPVGGQAAADGMPEEQQGPSAQPGTASEDTAQIASRAYKAANEKLQQ